MAEPRRSTDEEEAPLLNHDTEQQSLFASLMHPPRKLTNLEKILAAVSIVLLILMSTFVGLFASAEKHLKTEKGRHDGGGGGGGHGGVTTTTQYATRTTTVGSSPTGKPEHGICLTAECVKLSASILANLNESVDPCDDFYQYATGGWQETHSIPEDRGLLGAFNEVSDRNKKILLNIISAIPEESETASSAEKDNLHKLKAVYTSCMDVDRLNDLGFKPFKPLVEHLLDVFAPFDLQPAPDAEVASAQTDCVGAYDDSYAVPADLAVRAASIGALRQSRTFGRPTEAKHLYELDSFKEDDETTDKDQVHKLTKTLAYLHSRGVDALFGFNVEGDAGGEDSQVQSLWFYQTQGGLPSKEYYEEKPILDLYTSVVTDILIDIASHIKSSDDKEKRDLIGDIVAEAIEVEQSGWPWPWPGDDKPKPPPEDGEPDNKTKEEPIDVRMERLATKVVHFERELMRAGADPEYLFNPHYSYNPYPAEKVDKNLPIIDLRAYLSTFNSQHYPVNITVTYPPYLKSVSRLVQDTPDYVLSGYFATRLAFTYSGALGPKVGVRQATKRLGDVLKGIKKGTEENRQDTCLAAVDGIVGFIAGREYVREAFSAEAKEDGTKIINSVVDAFYNKLPHVSWMDETSYKAAQKKAKSIIPKVGYPLTPNTTDPVSLQNWYRRVSVSADDYFGSILSTVLVEEQRAWAGLGKQRDRQTWEMYPQTVNAYYSPPDGEIVFPAGILQSPFYSYEWPEHLKYGAFGAVAAHELTHAFDNSGSQYDEHGRLRDWWTKSTVEAFEERSQCIARQYSKYYVLDAEGNKVYVNGNLTNGEDIGDSGLAQAFIAWKSAVESSSASHKDLRLPGLDYTPEQLFFLAYARVWAQLTRPATAVSRIRTDPHSPPYWRATGTLRNLKAFHEAFGCKAGSRMNPPKEDQCELW